MNLRDQLIGFEGWVNTAYPDPLTHAEPFTIGVGHTGPEVHQGLTWGDTLISDTLDADIATATQECKESFPWFDQLNEPRQAVLIGAVFQMGLSRLLKFVHMLADIRDQRWPNAAEELRSSVWATQTPKRTIRLAHQLETGEWS